MQDFATIHRTIGFTTPKKKNIKEDLGGEKGGVHFIGLDNSKMEDFNRQPDV
jgi:hypothetical protein